MKIYEWVISFCASFLPAQRTIQIFHCDWALNSVSKLQLYVALNEFTPPYSPISPHPYLFFKIADSLHRYDKCVSLLSHGLLRLGVLLKRPSPYVWQITNNWTTDKKFHHHCLTCISYAVRFGWVCCARSKRKFLISLMREFSIPSWIILLLTSDTNSIKSLIYSWQCYST